MPTAHPFAIGVCLVALAAPTAGERHQHRATPEAVPTAWGKPVGGLRAGIRLASGGRGPGAVLRLSIVVRNVGRSEAVLYQSSALYFWGESDGGVVAARPAFAYGGFAQPDGYFLSTLAPGKEYDLLGDLAIHRPTAGPALARRTRVAPGTYRVGVDRFELRVGGRQTTELGTG